MAKLKLYSISFIMVFCVQIAFAQMNYSTKNKKAIKFFDTAMENFQAKDYKTCESNLQKALKEDEQFIEAHMLLGQIYDEQKQYEKAISAFNNVIDIDPDFFPNVFFTVADEEFTFGRYQDSKAHFEKYLTFTNNPPKIKKRATFLLQCAILSIDLINHPVPFVPVNLGDSINSEFSEYSPSLTIDEQTMIVTRLRPADKNTITGRSLEEDFYSCIKNNDGSSGKMRPVGPPLNSHGNEGCPSLTADGKLLYFTICDRSDGMGSCDIYYSERKGNLWSAPINMGVKVNSTAWDTQIGRAHV